MSTHARNMKDQMDEFERYIYNSGFMFGAIAGFAAGVVVASTLIIALTLYLRG